MAVDPPTAPWPPTSARASTASSARSSASPTTSPAIGWGYLAVAARRCRWRCRSAAPTPGRTRCGPPTPTSAIREGHVIAAFLIGAGLNGILPAKGGDAVKIVLGKRSVPRFDLPGDHLLVRGAGAVRHRRRHPRPALRDHPGPAATAAPAPGPARLRHLVLGGPPGPLPFHRDRLARSGVLVLFAVLARRAEGFWNHLKQGVAIVREPRRYLREVVAWQAAGWACRFASFWLFLDAFHIGGSFETVLLVMSVQAISGALPFTPGRGGRAAGAAGGHARRARRARRCSPTRSASRSRSPCGRCDRRRGDGVRLPHPRLARADPRGRGGDARREEGRARPGAASSSRTRAGSACP